MEQERKVNGKVQTTAMICTLILAFGALGTMILTGHSSIRADVGQLRGDVERVREEIERVRGEVDQVGDSLIRVN